MRKEVVALAFAGLMIGIPGVVGEEKNDPVLEQIIQTLDSLCTTWGQTAEPIVTGFDPNQEDTVEESVEACKDAVGMIPSDWGACFRIINGDYDLIADLDTDPIGHSGGIDFHIPIAGTSLTSIDLPPQAINFAVDSAIDIRQMNPRVTEYMAFTISGPGMDSRIGIC